jgi:hypothetical protein
MAVALCSELVTDEHEPLELPSSSSYSAALMHGVAEQVRATISAYPPPTRAEELRQRCWARQWQRVPVASLFDPKQRLDVALECLESLRCRRARVERLELNGWGRLSLSVAPLTELEPCSRDAARLG